MKSILALTIVLFSSFSLIGQTLNLEQFIDQCLKINGHDYIEVDKKDLKQFNSKEGFDKITEDLLKGIKLFRILECKNEIAELLLTPAEQRPHSGNIYSFNSVRVKNLDSNQKEKLINSKRAVNIVHWMVPPENPNKLFEKAKAEIDLSHYSVLETSSQDGRNLLLLGRIDDRGLTKYLLLTGNKVISIKGHLKQFHIKDLENLEKLVALKYDGKRSKQPITRL